MPKHRFVSNISMIYVAIARYYSIFVNGRNWAGFINIKHSGYDLCRNCIEPTQKQRGLAFSLNPLFLSLVNKFHTIFCPLPLKNLLKNDISFAKVVKTAQLNLHWIVARNLTVSGFFIHLNQNFN